MRKRLLSFVLAVLMIASLLPATALAANIVDSGTCGAEVTWTLDSDGVLTISGSGYMCDYGSSGAPWHGRVKSAVIAEGVTSIGWCAFYDCASLTSVTIPDSVTRIGSYAFYDCRSLTSVTIPDSVTRIGDGAFEGCTSLTSVTIPDSVTSIGGDTFRYCTALTSVTIPNSVTSIGGWAFYNCTSLTSVTIPDSVTRIGDWAFYNCTSLTSVTIPNSVTLIDNYAFKGCESLTSVTIPDSVTSIGKRAFSYCKSLTDVYYAGSEAQWKAISISSTGNDDLLTANIHYNYVSHTHSYKDVVTAPTCTEKGYTTHTCACGDSYVDTYVDALGHTWDSGKVTKQPTETETGVKTYTCTRCGETRTETMPVLPHTHSYKAVVTAPTCTDKGYTTHTCACGDSYVDAYTDALGHAWDNGKVTKEPTETETGVKTFTCTRCGETRTETMPVIPHVHSYKDVVTAPTCTAKGYTTHTCVCGDSYVDSIVPATGHSWGTWTKDDNDHHKRVCANDASHVETNPHVWDGGIVTTEATCTEAGVKTYTCSDCKATKTEPVEATGHKYGDITYTWSKDNTSCTAKKVCSVCKDEVTETVDTTSSVTTPATCTTKGTKTYTATFSAANGFVTQTKNVDIAATGHDWSNKDGICAVCHTKCDRVHKPGTTCEVCGKYTRRPSSSNAGSIISVPSTPNGTMTVNPSTASKGETVTITTKPSEGYELGSIEVLDKNGDSLKLKDLGNGKYSFVMPDGKVSVEAEFVKTASTGFADVPANAYFADAVKWAVNKGISNGLTDTMFGPYESCTRAQIVTFLWRAAGSPEPKTASSFTDIPVSAYYAKAVAWAVENGITNGMTATEFAPDATCTRGQSVTFLYRALKGTASGSTNFTDVKSDAFYADAVNWAVASDVTNGTSNTTFSPNADCTRAEIVTFLYRAYQGK